MLNSHPLGYSSIFSICDLSNVFIFILCLLFIISTITAKSDSNDAFFIGNRNSPWYIVAYGMLGTTLSGITFISVPGWVGDKEFSYLQMVFGFFVGYFIISRILLPLYYKLGLVSIYTYLKDRFGNNVKIKEFQNKKRFFDLGNLISITFEVISNKIEEKLIFKKFGL